MFGFGMDINSSAAQSSPFANNAGITIGGDSGGISGLNDATATATSQKTVPATRQLSGGLNAFSDSSFPSGISLGGDSSIWLIIGGGAIALIAVVYLMFRK